MAVMRDRKRRGGEGRGSAVIERERDYWSGNGVGKGRREEEGVDRCFILSCVVRPKHVGRIR